MISRGGSGMLKPFLVHITRPQLSRRYARALSPLSSRIFTSSSILMLTIRNMHTLANQLRSSQKDTWAFYASVDGLSLGTIKSWPNSYLKSAWRDHT